MRRLIFLYQLNLWGCRWSSYNRDPKTQWLKYSRSLLFPPIIVCRKVIQADWVWLAHFNIWLPSCFWCGFFRFYHLLTSREARWSINDWIEIWTRIYVNQKSDVAMPWGNFPHYSHPSHYRPDTVTLSPASGGIISLEASLRGGSWCFLPLYHHCCCLVAQLCLTLCNPRDCTVPGFPILHCLPEFAQAHVLWVSDALRCHASCNSLPRWMELICVVSGVLWTGYSECLLRRLSP